MIKKNGCEMELYENACYLRYPLTAFPCELFIPGCNLREFNDMHESLFFYIELNWRLLENARKKIYRTAAFPLFSGRRMMEKLCLNIRVLKFEFMFEIFMYFIYSATLAYTHIHSLIN
jgi:hypothetical protein